MVAFAKYKHRITFQTSVETQDELGGITESWQDYDTVWAKVEMKGGREFYKNHKLQLETTHLIETRHRNDIDTKMRVLWKGRAFRIVSLINIDEKILLVEAKNES